MNPALIRLNQQRRRFRRKTERICHPCRRSTIAQSEAQPLGGRRILMVEDNFAVARDLSPALENLGAIVVGRASSVAKAMALEH
jgi:hypothetical protein